MFCIHPIVALINDEFNLKLFEMDEYLDGSFVKADTTSIKETDITTMATALDKLFAIGAVSVNDVSEKVGTDPIDEDWANKRYVTKNYQEAKLMIENQDSKGGDKDDKKEQPKQIRI